MTSLENRICDFCTKIILDLRPKGIFEEQTLSELLVLLSEYRLELASSQMVSRVVIRDLVKLLIAIDTQCNYVDDPEYLRSHKSKIELGIEDVYDFKLLGT